MEMWFCIAMFTMTMRAVGLSLGSIKAAIFSFDWKKISLTWKNQQMQNKIGPQRH
jgi:hypothetical protein